MEREIMIGCVHFRHVPQCSQDESRTEIGRGEYGIRITKGSLSLKLSGQSFCYDKSSGERAARKTDCAANGQLG